MAISLKKGERINLSKANPNLKKVRAGLGWGFNATDTGNAYDLDVSVFVCKHDAAGNPKLIDDPFMVFYGQPQSPDGAVVYSGDNRTGAGEGDDETITVDLTKLDQRAMELSFVVTIHEAIARRQNFGQIPRSYIHLYDDATGELLAKYELEDEFSSETALQVGSFYKKDGAWLFKAVGAGYNKGLAEFVIAYGGNLEG